VHGAFLACHNRELMMKSNEPLAVGPKMRTTGTRISSAFGAANDHSASTLRMLSDILGALDHIFRAMRPFSFLFFVVLLRSFKFPNMIKVSRQLVSTGVM